MSIVTNPGLPFWGVIPGGLKIGSLIIINGHVLPDATSFQFNFIAGEVVNDQTKRNADIGLHFNARFGREIVVRNTRQNGGWGPEEREPKLLPFQNGRMFEVMFLVEQTEFKVAVDGKHFVSYKHRLPFTSLKILNIEGTLIVQKIEYRQEVAFGPGNPMPVVGFNTSGYLPPIFNPTLPFQLPLVGGLKAGLMVYISGKPTPTASRFFIEFMKTLPGQSLEIADVAMHFNPRFDEKIVVRNSRFSGFWGEEHRLSPEFPFAPGANFDMIIRIEGNRYLIAVNGQHFIEFFHRLMPLNTVNMLHIDGDLGITTIRFHVA
ncbi:Galectin-4 [Halotydeus destructor]|nr:Galectin-4 [Halotydeus destructor]